MTDGNNQTQSFSSNAMAVPDNIPMGPHTRSQGFPPAYTELEALSADPIHDNLGKSGMWLEYSLAQSTIRFSRPARVAHLP